MARNEKSLSKKELIRKEHFENLCFEMEQKGYEIKNLTVSPLQANLVALIIMLPFMALTAWGYCIVNHTIVFSLKHRILLIIAFLLTIVIHELIHGVTWGIFAKGHFQTIQFGIMKPVITPYCTCSQPMKPWQYNTGCIMPTLILGFGLAVASIALDSFFLLLLSELNILMGGGDFFVILKILSYHSKSKVTLYCPHPYEGGIVAFEKR